MKLTLKTLYQTVIKEALGKGKVNRQASPKNFYKQEKYNQRVYCHEF